MDPRQESWGIPSLEKSSTAEDGLEKIYRAKKT